MVKDRNVDEELAELLHWTGAAQPQLSWEEVSSETGIQYPRDFKALSARFPSGAFADYFYFYSPVQNRDSLRFFRTYWATTLNYLDELQEQNPERAPYPLFPQAGGIIPWALGDEHTFCWRVLDVNHPDAWKVVFGDSATGSWGEYDGNASSFILDVITGNFSNDYLYYEVDESQWEFHPYPDYLQ